MRSSAPALSKFTRLWVISRTCPTSVPLHLLCLPSRRFFWLCTAGFIPAFLSQLTCSHFTGKLHFPWPLPLKWPPTLILIRSGPFTAYVTHETTSFTYLFPCTLSSSPPILNKKSSFAHVTQVLSLPQRTPSFGLYTLSLRFCLSAVDGGRLSYFM